MPEAGRAIIQDQLAIGGRALPWADLSAFAELMRFSGLPIPAHIDRAARMFRYHRRVFVAPPWPEIFTPDRAKTRAVRIIGARIIYAVPLEASRLATTSVMSSAGGAPPVKSSTCRLMELMMDSAV